MSAFSFIGNLFTGWGRNEEKFSKLSVDQFDKLIDYFYVGYPNRTGRTVTQKEAITIAAVYASIKVLSNSIATMPLVTYRRNSDGSRDIAKDHPLYKVLKFQPNMFMTPFQFKQWVVLMNLFFGSSPSRIIYNRRSEVVRLHPMHPNRVKRNLVGNIHEAKIEYEFVNADNDIEIIKQEDVFDPILFSTDGVNGGSLFESARETFGLSVSADSLAARFFKNGAVTSGLFKYPGKLEPADKQQMKQAFMEAFTGSEQYGIGVMDQGVEFEPITIDPEKSQLLEARKYQVLEVARFFGVPPHKIGELDNANFSNVTEQNKAFLTDSLLPILVCFEEAGLRDLVSVKDRNHIFIEFMTDNLLRADVKTRWEVYRAASDLGAMNIDEIRQKENMKPLPNGLGKRYCIALNRIPIDRHDELLDQKMKSGSGMNDTGGGDGETPADGSKDGDINLDKQLASASASRGIEQQSVNSAGIGDSESVPVSGGDGVLSNQIDIGEIENSLTEKLSKQLEEKLSQNLDAQLDERDRSLKISIERATQKSEEKVQIYKMNLRGVLIEELQQAISDAIEWDVNGIEKSLKRLQRRDKFRDWLQSYEYCGMDNNAEKINACVKKYALAYHQDNTAENVNDVTRNLGWKNTSIFDSVFDNTPGNGVFTNEEKTQLKSSLNSAKLKAAKNISSAIIASIDNYYKQNSPKETEYASTNNN